MLDSQEHQAFFFSLYDLDLCGFGSVRILRGCETQRVVELVDVDGGPAAPSARDKGVPPLRFERGPQELPSLVRLHLQPNRKGLLDLAAGAGLLFGGVVLLTKIPGSLSGTSAGERPKFSRSCTMPIVLLCRGSMWSLRGNGLAESRSTRIRNQNSGK